MITDTQARQLLDKYFAGDSSLQEEAQLRDYYRKGNNYPADLAKYADLFRFFEAESQLVLSTALTKKLAQPPAGRYRQLRQWWAVAAAIALLLMATIVWWQQPQPQLAQTEETIDWSKYEIKDPTEAFQVAHGALKRTSVALQKSTRRAAREVQQVHKILPK